MTWSTVSRLFSDFTKRQSSAHENRHSNVQQSPKCQWMITKAEIIRSSTVLPRHQSEVGIEILQTMLHVIIGSNQKAGIFCAKESPRAGKIQIICWIQDRVGMRSETELFADYPAAYNGAIAKILWEKLHASNCYFRFLVQSKLKL